LLPLFSCRFNTACKMHVHHLQSVRYRIPFPGNLSMAPYRCPPPPFPWATRKQRTNKLGRCYQPERPFCTLTRYSLPSRTAQFTYMCLSAQVGWGETRVHDDRWHAGRSLLSIKAAGTRFIYLFIFVFCLTKCRIIGLLVRIEL
jgi:hypothetical protein